MLTDVCEEATEYQLVKVVEAKGLEALTLLLHEQNIELLKRTLEGINAILAAGEEGEEEENELLKYFDSLGGYTKLQDLLIHPNDCIFSKARAMVQKYYAMDELQELLKFKALSDTLSSL